MSKAKNLLIIGTGYVGAASAIHLSMQGHSVFVHDINPEVMRNWKNRILPYADEDLQQALSGFRTRQVPVPVEDLPGLKEKLDGIFICVDTAADSEKGYNIERLKSAVKNLKPLITGEKNAGVKVFVRSTLPPGCMHSTIYPLVQQLWSDSKVRPDICYFPEFLREGSALEDLSRPPLRLIGNDNPVKKGVYKKYFGHDVHVAPTSVAELVKISSNAFHALKVAFANEIGMIGSQLGIDAVKAMQIFCEDEKLNISRKYLQPGFAFGGPCLKKEIHGLMAHAGMDEGSLPVLGNILPSNVSRLKFILNTVMAKTKNHRRVGVLGVSFKGESVDTRNSPVLELVESLKKKIRIQTFDHNISAEGGPEFKKFIGDCDYLLLGSASLSKKQSAAIMKLKKPVLDLAINFSNRSLFKGYVNYSSITDAI